MWVQFSPDAPIFMFVEPNNSSLQSKLLELYPYSIFCRFDTISRDFWTRQTKEEAHDARVALEKVLTSNFNDEDFVAQHLRLNEFSDMIGFKISFKHSRDLNLFKLITE